MPLSALVVWWVSRGVLRARTVRTWLAGILLGLIALFGVVGLFAATSLYSLAGAVTGAVAFVALLSYTRSDCYARMREEPDRTAPDLSGVLMLAVVAGSLGGLAAPIEGQGHGFHVRIGL